MPPYKASNPTHIHYHECLNKTSLAADAKTTCFPSDCHLINDCELQSCISETVQGVLLYFWYSGTCFKGTYSSSWQYKD